MKLHIIAEAVESEEQKEFLLQHGCDLIQGYYSKPVSEQDFTKLLISTGQYIE